MAELLRVWSHMTQFDKRQPATDGICDGSMFDNASAVCVIIPR